MKLWKSELLQLWECYEVSMICCEFVPKNLFIAIILRDVTVTLRCVPISRLSI